MDTRAVACICFCWLTILIMTSDCISLDFDTEACPVSCVCHVNSTIVCQNIDLQLWSDTCQSIKHFTIVKQTSIRLRLEGLLSNTTLSFDCLPALQSLDVSLSKLHTIPSTFKDIGVVQELILTQNEIHLLPDNMFTSLGNIYALNLSLNNISDLTEKTFSGLYSLQSLDLSYNNIKSIDPSILNSLSNLTYLNLGHNGIERFTSWHLPRSSLVEVLILDNNMLKSFYIGENESDAMSFNNIQVLDISNNPLECSCILQKVLNKVSAQGGVIDNVENTLCSSPMPLKNYSVDHLNETALICSSPHNLLSFPSKEKSVLYRSTITLECRAEAYPSPHILWVTPWGEKFSLAPKSLILHKGFGAGNEINFFREYKERNVMMTTSIKVTPKNDLVISRFRGSMTGNFSCIAFNEVGSKQEVIHLSVHSMIKSTYLTSLKFASYCASVVLIIGFIIGLIHILIRKLRHKHSFKVPLFTPAASVHPVEDGRTSIYDDFSPPTSPLLGCMSDKSVLSSPCVHDGGESPEKRPHHILDSLEGAKERLRDGVGRKMESVRRNVQSIKESTGAYVHTIMESGSSAANKMKAGVVLGVETVKYHVQSVKELCGTGNMGAHTVSIISMETDIDTNQQKSVVRQVTFV